MTISLDEAHDHSFKNRDSILKSDVCGCFQCLALFVPYMVTEWADEQQTALCPFCGIDSVIGTDSGIELTEKFLKAMRNKWFDSIDNE